MGTLGFKMLGHLASFRSLESTAVMFMQTLKGNYKIGKQTKQWERTGFGRWGVRGGQEEGVGNAGGGSSKEWEVREIQVGGNYAT